MLLPSLLHKGTNVKNNNLVLFLVVGLIAWIFLFRAKSVVPAVSPTSNPAGTNTPAGVPSAVASIVQGVAELFNSQGSAPQANAKTL